MYFYPTVIIDDFLKDPIKIRDYALTLEYKKGPNFSGVRTDSVFQFNSFLAHEICKKILISCGLPYNEYRADVHFHLTGEEFGSEGWPHTDSGGDEGSKFASIVYLNFQPSHLNSGTSIFRLKNFKENHSSIHLMQESFHSGVDNLKVKTEVHDNFEETIRVGGIFNRMIAYDSRRPHCGNGYFGTDMTSQRLTLLVFFTKIITNIPQNLTPFVYSDMLSSI